MRTAAILTVLVCLLGFYPPAWGADSNPSLDHSTGNVLSNQNEAPQQCENNIKMTLKGFIDLDTNKDGFISWEEWQAMDHSPDAREHFDALDENKDGKISFQEFMHSHQSLSKNDAASDAGPTRFLQRDGFTDMKCMPLFNTKF